MLETFVSRKRPAEQEINMKITVKDVQDVANLARLSFSQDELELFARQLDQILTYVEKLNELDTTGVEPVYHALEITNAFREDVVQPSLENETALKNAPSETDGYFTVPRVI